MEKENNTSNKIKLIITAVCLIAIAVIVVVMAIPKQNKVSKQKSPQAKKDRSINIFWAEWVPAYKLRELSQDFTKETGIKVTVQTEPWATFQKVFFEEMSRKGQAFDLVLGDSQWLGRGATEGHYIDLTKWIKQHGVDKQMTPTAMVGYSEYPKGSKRYWAIPGEGDAVGFAYRKDLFEKPEEMSAFKKKYGYKLDVPKTWNQLRDIAEFFHRPKDDLYGIALFTQPDYDAVAMALECWLWSYGGSLGDMTNYRVKNLVNSPESIEALKFYKEIFKFIPPDWHDAYFYKCMDGLTKGKTVMSMNFFAMFPDYTDPKVNPYAKDTGFFACPEGPKGRYAALGGQGFSVISYSKNKNLSFKYLEWFIRDDVQEKWAMLGGFSCNKKVLSSEKFLNAKPFNRPFMESMKMVKDFWAVPEYTKLLAIGQKHWFKYLTTNEITAEEAMNAVATEWENVFEYNGYYKE